LRIGAFLVALLAVGVVLVVRPGSDQASGGGAAAGQLLLLYNSHGSVPRLAANAGRYSYVVLQPWDTAGLRAVKKRNPRAIVLAYQEASAIARAPGVNGVTASGVGFSEADRHPNWFLQDHAGNRITENGYSYLYMAAIGNRGYQQAWAANVSRLLRRGPWDGVLMDDVNSSAGYHVDPARVAQYPNDAAYTRATRSFLDYIRPRLRATGKREFANMGGWVDNPQVIRQWLHKLDGGMDEAFVKFEAGPGQGYRDRFKWALELNQVRAAERMGKRVLVVTRTQPNDEQGKLYGWASLLLASSRRAGYLPATGFGYDDVPPTVGPAERDGGAPRGAARPAGRVVYRRFSRALVVVNPDSASHVVRFRAPMSGSGLNAAGAVTLAGHSALVLHRASSPRHAPPQRPVSS